MHSLGRTLLAFTLFHSVLQGQICLLDLYYCGIEWFALEMNRDHSVVFEIASKYSILDPFVDLLSAAKDGEALYNQQKQDWELTVAQIMISLLQTSGLN